MPLRSLAGVILGIAVWICLFMAVGIGFGLILPEYREAARELFGNGDSSLFTTPLYLLNWVVFTVIGLIAGAVAAVVSRNRTAPMVLAAIYLIAMIADHYILAWDTFPVWYNLIVPFVIAGTLYLGASLAAKRLKSTDPRTV